MKVGLILILNSNRGQERKRCEMELSPHTSVDDALAKTVFQVAVNEHHVSVLKREFHDIIKFKERKRPHCKNRSIRVEQLRNRLEECRACGYNYQIKSNLERG